MTQAILLSLGIYALAFIISMLVALMITGLFALLRRLPKNKA
jgi:hypothetical protein